MSARDNIYRCSVKLFVNHLQNEGIVNMARYVIVRVVLSKNEVSFRESGMKKNATCKVVAAITAAARC